MPAYVDAVLLRARTLRCWRVSLTAVSRAAIVRFVSARRWSGGSGAYRG